MHTDLMYMRYYMKSYHVFQYVAKIVGSFFCRINIPYIGAKNCLKKCPFCLRKGTRSDVFKEDKPEVRP